MSPGAGSFCATFRAFTTCFTQYSVWCPSLGYQLASIIAGGPAPIIATYLLARSFAPQAALPAWVLIALYIIATALITGLSALPLKEYAGRAAREEG